ncbi:ribbon-helix-helix domain-containing protein [Azospirillum picis]|uniref:DNA-binding ribbon-helix-helix protein n=1 Tax=Azospirillum picis TaxID=488438 RepID=A0ABU0MUM5_9PROT|nr:ribbon-helix-helix domain-containing protein [Azospirillum picis]MBP2303343.1 putative DNA-binding ribbon-helix-helix protein [Azospirillum picis]MDQ0537175.1 putative DNA-binding ribbon-helix-helix protein [Azospirillum picis]
MTDDTKAARTVRLAVDLTAAPVRRVVRLNGRRTSVALEPVMWEGLEAIAAREGLDSVAALLSHLDQIARGPDGKPPVNLTSVVRVYVAAYYRAAAEPDDGTL